MPKTQDALYRWFAFEPAAGTEYGHDQVFFAQALLDNARYNHSGPCDRLSSRCPRRNECSPEGLFAYK